MSNPNPWSAQFLAHDTPVNLVAGSSVVVNVRVKNTGARVWHASGAYAIHLGYTWINENDEPQLDIEDRRTGLPTDLAPNQDIAFGAVLVAPQTPGMYTVEWDLRAPDSKWFGDPLIVPITVTAMPGATTGWRAESNVNPTQVAWAIDGDPQTFWNSNTEQKSGQWFRLNLSAPRVIDGAQFLSPGKGFPFGYVLRASADGKTWIELARVASDNAHDLLAVFAPQMIQYLQVDLIASAPSHWMIADILIHAATAWKGSASHNPNAASRAIDHRADTAWSTDAQSPGMWFQIDLGRVETISGLFVEGNHPPANFRIAIWNASASRWQVVADQSNNRDAVNIEFATMQTQFINIQITGAANRPWSIARVNVLREMESWLGPAD